MNDERVRLHWRTKVIGVESADIDTATDRGSNARESQREMPKVQLWCAVHASSFGLRGGVARSKSAV